MFEFKGDDMRSNTLAVNWVRRGIALVVVAAAAAASGVAGAAADAQSEQQELVTKAESTFSNFMRDPDMTWLQRHIGEAKGVLIAPQVLRAGWIFGGAGGRGVLFVRNASTGQWTGPGFYDIAAATVGFQAGVEVSETVTLVMTDKAASSLAGSSVKLGGDASIAAGPVGAGANRDITADFVAFSRSKGVYGGLNLEGSVVKASDNWNQAYYGKAVPSADILHGAVAHNRQADHFLAELNRASSGQKTSSR